MEQRIEHDTMGEVAVPADKLWGAQTQRSFENFPIGEEKMPPDLIHAFGVLKEACAAANHRLGTLDTRRYQLIQSACQAIRAGELAEQFPLSVWQTGSGTQTNMNCNEVIAHVGNAQAGETLLHPNDHVNLSQSSNDTFPSALHIAAVTALHTRLEPALTEMLLCLQRLETDNQTVVKTGRTHLQDAVPITFGQEISGWRSMLEHARDMIRASLAGLYELALGGTAVGTGLNAPPGFDAAAAEEVARLTGLPFRPAPNKFHALSARDGLVFSHGALKALAADLMKLANDVRWLASGPRCGLGEIFIPENEPGSSIMPGKVNPVIPEVVNQIAFRIIGYDTTVTLAVEAGQLELNAFEPVIFDSLYQGLVMLQHGIHTLNVHCLQGVRANEEVCRQEVERSVGVVTALCPKIGYNAACSLAREALRTNRPVGKIALEWGLLTEQELQTLLDPAAMTSRCSLQDTEVDAVKGKM